MLLVKYSEIMLKSRATRAILERRLEGNLRHALEGCRFRLRREGGVFFIEADDEERYVEKLRKVFGVVYISVCDVVPAEIESIAEKCVEIGRKFKSGSSFAIRAKRVGEHSFSSRELCVEAGKRMLEELRGKKLKVNLDEPDEEIFVYVRGNRTFISRENIRAYGGMPLGSQGKVVALVEDRGSCLAAWMMMRRGCELIVVCNKKRRRLAEELREWHIGREMEVRYLIPKGSSIMGEAGRLARERGALGVVSGESLCKGRTLARIRKLDVLAGIPVYRPLILLEERMVIA